MASDETLAQRLTGGDRRALARAISLVENDRPEGWELVREVYPRTGGAAVVGNQDVLTVQRIRLIATRPSVSRTKHRSTLSAGRRASKRS